MLVTINTDASYSLEKGTAGWACWIVCNGVRVKRYGKFKTLPKHSGYAEAQAVIIALHVLSLEASFIPSKIIINCDMISVKDLIDKDAELTMLYSKYIVLMGNPIVEHRHVKGHSGTESPRKYVNDWCDKMSRLASGAKARKVKK
jgi:ribonuclease HI